MKKPVTLLTVLIFWLIGVAHLMRLIYNVPVTVGTIQIPMWISIPGFIVPPIIAILLWREAKSSPKKLV